MKYSRRSDETSTNGTAYQVGSTNNGPMHASLSGKRSSRPCRLVPVSLAFCFSISLSLPPSLSHSLSLSLRARPPAIHPRRCAQRRVGVTEVLCLLRRRPATRFHRREFLIGCPYHNSSRLGIHRSGMNSKLVGIAGEQEVYIP